MLYILISTKFAHRQSYIRYAKGKCFLVHQKSILRVMGSELIFIALGACSLYELVIPLLPPNLRGGLSESLQVGEKTMGAMIEEAN